LRQGGQQTWKAGQSEKRQFDQSVTVEGATERVGLALRDRRAGQKRDRRHQYVGIEDFVTEEVEVHRLAMTEMPSQSCPAIMDEVPWHAGQFIPKATLGRRQDVETPDEVRVHTSPSSSMRH
jgi:hypothetical protein